MELVDGKVVAAKQEWFQSWFDTHYYHKLYSNRDETEASRFITALLKDLKPEQGSVMLDLGCGGGRHSRQLAENGYRVTGLDLSASSIREAKKSALPNIIYGCHDMRNPFGRKYYDYIFNLFTSFGYFDTQCEHDGIMHNISEALKTGGTLVLDYMNTHFTEQRLVAEETKEIDGILYHIKRWKDEKYIYKDITIDDFGTGDMFEYTEKVARFTLVDFYKMCLINELRVIKIYGDYNLNSFDRKNSPRLIIVAEKG